MDQIEIHFRRAERKKKEPKNEHTERQIQRGEKQTNENPNFKSPGGEPLGSYP